MSVHGKNTYLALDNAEGTLTELMVMATESGLARSLETADATTFASAGTKEYVAGLNDATGSISGLFTIAEDAWITEAFDALAAGTVDSLTFRFGPAGGALGKPYTDSEVIITAYEVSSSVGDLVSATLSLQRTGPSTPGTFVA